MYMIQVRLGTRDKRLFSCYISRWGGGGALNAVVCLAIMNLVSITARQNEQRKEQH